jgi:hypothetical protein
MKNKNVRFYSYNKYKNKSCKCLSGHIHDSRGEARYCDTLKLALSAKQIKDYAIQKTYPLIVNGSTITRHRVDFVVTTLEDKLEVHECKGFATEAWKIKMKLFEACYPDIKYLVIKL